MFKNEHFSANIEHTFSMIPLVLRVNLQAFGIDVKSIPANTRHCQIAFLDDSSGWFICFGSMLYAKRYADFTTVTYFAMDFHPVLVSAIDLRPTNQRPRRV